MSVFSGRIFGALGRRSGPSAMPEWKNFEVMIAGTDAIVPVDGALAKLKEMPRAASASRLGVVSRPDFFL